MKNISKKQMITLIVLIVILILVIAVQYFYRPILSKKAELTEKVDSMNMVYEDMKMLAAFYSIDSVTYKEEKELLDKKRRDFLPFMKNGQQDNMITNMLLSCNLVIESSDVSPFKADTVQVKCSVMEDGEDGVDAYSVISMYPQGEKVVSSTEDTVVLEYETGEYSREIYYDIAGRYGDIIRFLSMVYNEKSMEISSFYFNSGNLNGDKPYNSSEIDDLIEELEEGNPVDSGVVNNTVYKAGIGIKVYMYDRNFTLKSRTD